MTHHDGEVSEVIDGAPKKRGRKPSPLTHIIRDYERANAKVCRLRKRHGALVEHLDRVEAELAEAEAEADAARKALEDLIGSGTN